MNNGFIAGVLWLSLAVAQPIAAALPVAVEGQALPSLAPMLEQVTPAVVNIATKGKAMVRESLFNDPFFQRFFNAPGIQREKVVQSLGSGVIVDAKQGYILTNNHVIEAALQITVTLADGRSLSAKVVGRDEATDVAVIQVEAERLEALSFGDSANLRVGDFVVAIGNPFGLGQTVTSGIVSALGRSGLGIESYEDFIQTDASINPGNSGGALVNLRGELIGINTAILGTGGDSQGNIGIGFAIPIQMAADIMEQLIEHGEVHRGRLGAQAQNLSAELAQAMGLADQTGVVVTRVERNSAADIAGLRVGDVIVAANQRPIRQAMDIYNLVGLMRIGQKLELQVLRNGESLTLKAQIEAQQIPTLSGQTLDRRLEGAVLGEVWASDFESESTATVVFVEVEEDSPAWQSGLREGDRVEAVNRRTVRTLKQLQEAASSGAGRILLNIDREGQALYLLLQ